MSVPEVPFDSVLTRWSMLDREADRLKKEANEKLVTINRQVQTWTQAQRVEWMPHDRAGMRQYEDQRATLFLFHSADQDQLIQLIISNELFQASGGSTHLVRVSEYLRRGPANFHNLRGITQFCFNERPRPASNLEHSMQLVTFDPADRKPTHHGALDRAADVYGYCGTAEPIRRRDLKQDPLIDPLVEAERVLGLLPNARLQGIWNAKTQTATPI